MLSIEAHKRLVYDQIIDSAIELANAILRIVSTDMNNSKANIIISDKSISEYLTSYRFSMEPDDFDIFSTEEILFGGKDRNNVYNYVAYARSVLLLLSLAHTIRKVLYGNGILSDKRLTELFDRNPLLILAAAYDLLKHYTYTDNTANKLFAEAMKDFVETYVDKIFELSRQENSAWRTDRSAYITLTTLLALVYYWFHTNVGYSSASRIAELAQERFKHLRQELLHICKSGGEESLKTCAIYLSLAFETEDKSFLTDLREANSIDRGYVEIAERIFDRIRERIAMRMEKLREEKLVKAMEKLSRMHAHEVSAGTSEESCVRPYVPRNVSELSISAAKEESSMEEGISIEQKSHTTLEDRIVETLVSLAKSGGKPVIVYGPSGCGTTITALYVVEKAIAKILEDKSSDKLKQVTILYFYPYHQYRYTRTSRDKGESEEVENILNCLRRKFQNEEVRVKINRLPLTFFETTFYRLSECLISHGSEGRVDARKLAACVEDLLNKMTGKSGLQGIKELIWRGAKGAALYAVEELVPAGELLVELFEELNEVLSATLKSKTYRPRSLYILVIDKVEGIEGLKYISVLDILSTYMRVLVPVVITSSKDVVRKLEGGYNIFSIECGLDEKYKLWYRSVVNAWLSHLGLGFMGSVYGRDIVDKLFFATLGNIKYTIKLLKSIAARYAGRREGTISASIALYDAMSVIEDILRKPGATMKEYVGSFNSLALNRIVRLNYAYLALGLAYILKYWLLSPHIYDMLTSSSDGRRERILSLFCACSRGKVGSLKEAEVLREYCKANRVSEDNLVSMCCMKPGYAWQYTWRCSSAHEPHCNPLLGTEEDDVAVNADLIGEWLLTLYIRPLIREHLDTAKHR